MTSQNPFNQAGRLALHDDPTAFLEWALGLPRNEPYFQEWLNTKNVPFLGDPDRIRDTVARIQDLSSGGEPWALVIEIQSSPDLDMVGRMNVYGGSLFQERKPDPEAGSRYWIGGLVVNLTGRAAQHPRKRLAQTKVESQNGPVQFNVNDHLAEDVLSKIRLGELGLGVLPWVPLTQGAERPEIILKWKELARRQSNAKKRSEYGGLALVFAERSGCHEIWCKYLEDWNVEESIVLNEWMKKGIEKGEKIGIEKGEKTGEEKGRRAELLNSLDIVLRNKFGDQGHQFVQELVSVQDLHVLRTIFHSSHEAQSIEALRALLAQE